MSRMPPLLRSAAAGARAERDIKRGATVLDRRTLVTGALGSVGLLAGPVGPAHGRSAAARIAVVGAGLAGLTAALRLRQAGHDPEVLEAATRLGGRCWSACGLFRDGQVVERGGEFIDTGHAAIRTLAGELGLTLDDVLAAQAPGGIPLYRFNRERYTLGDATRDFGAIYDTLQEQNRAIGTTADFRTASAAARRFDMMTLTDWITETVPGGRASKLGQLIENAFSEESAADPDRLSALDAIGTLAGNARDDFDLYYGGSDQRYRVRGGNDRIVAGLAERLDGAVACGTALTAVTRLGDGRLRLTLTRDGAVRDAVFDRVVLALPFAVLRDAVDHARAGFRPLKLRAIRDLGMGASVKFQLGFERRHWAELGCNGEIRPASPDFQTSWDTSRAQAGRSGVLNLWSGGSRARFTAGPPERDALACASLAGAEAILPGLGALWTGASTFDAWSLNPWSRGSYSYAPPGYRTTCAGVEGTPEGFCFFAGEHTGAQTGYMNSAVASGERAARQVLASLP